MRSIRLAAAKELLPSHWSEAVQRSARNASLSMAEYVATPLLYIFSTPFLVHQLGMNNYGIWMLANSVAGFVGTMNLGLSEATVKYVSFHQGGSDQRGVADCIRSTLTLSLSLSFLMALTGAALAPYLVHGVFKILPEDYAIATWAIQLGSAGMALRMLNSVFLGAMRGLERYDLTSKINVASTAGMLLSAVLLAALGFDLVAILLASVAVLALALLGSVVITRTLIRNLSVRPTLNMALLRPILGFGIYSWLQGLAATIFAQADRLVIGAMLGTSALSYYSIILQVAQQAHGLVASALSFLFPMISATAQSDGSAGRRRIYRKALFLSSVFAVVLALPLLIGARFILTLWMGADFATETWIPLSILIVAYFALALNVPPHFTLLGLGEIRFVSFTNIGGGALSLAAMFILTPALGITGAALSRLFYAPVVSLNFCRVQARL